MSEIERLTCFDRAQNKKIGLSLWSEKGLCRRVANIEDHRSPKNECLEKG